MSVRVPIDQPMPVVARLCVDAMSHGSDVELPVSHWRRPGLTTAIAVELESRGPVVGSWRFVDPAGLEAATTTDAADMLGWSGTRLAAEPIAPPAAPVVMPAPIQAPQVAPAAAAPGASSKSSLQASGMLLAAYAVMALAQPVMTAGLKPGPFGQPNHGAPITRATSMASALAELADLDL